MPPGFDRVQLADCHKRERHSSALPTPVPLVSNENTQLLAVPGCPVREVSLTNGHLTDNLPAQLGAVRKANVEVENSFFKLVFDTFNDLASETTISSRRVWLGLLGMGNPSLAHDGTPMLFALACARSLINDPRLCWPGRTEKLERATEYLEGIRARSSGELSCVAIEKWITSVAAIVAPHTCTLVRGALVLVAPTRPVDLSCRGLPLPA